MPPIDTAFLVAAVIIIVVPGPDMMFIVSTAARGGPMIGFMAAVGTAVGLTVHTAAAVAGLSALFAALPPLYRLLRWAGAAYLLYLAVQAFHAHGSAAHATPVSRPSRARAFWQGLLVDLSNPKTILFFVAFLPQFVAPELGHVSLQFLILGATFALTDFVIDGLIGLLLGRLTQAVRRNRGVERWVSMLSGTVLAGLAIRLATTRR